MAIMSFQGRTVPSPCAAQATRMFVTDDTGLYFVARVPDPDSMEMPSTCTWAGESLKTGQAGSVFTRELSSVLVSDVYEAI